MSKSHTDAKQADKQNPLLFVVPSALGLFCFMAPLAYNGQVSIPIAILAKSVLSLLGEYAPACVVALLVLFCVFSFIGTLCAPTFITQNPWLKRLFVTNRIGLLLQALGAMAGLSVLTGIGPEFLINKNTGGLVLTELLPPIVASVFFAGIFLPLLLNFGLLEFVGALMTRIMQPLFRLPGRSAIDCVTSWVGDSSVGALLTVRQYEEGYYTQREAAVIGTNFSAASITFCFLVLAQVQLEHMFGWFYLTTVIASFFAAIIVPRLPPLSRKKPIYIDGTERTQTLETNCTGQNAFQQGLSNALHKANTQPPFLLIFADGLKNAISMLGSVIATVMVVGSLGLILAEYTPILQVLGRPFVPVLEWFGLPEAQSASTTIVVGFADMFIPSTLAAPIASEMTRFVIAALSVSQVVFLSEIGAILLGSKIPVGFVDLLAVFLLRTVITLPIIICCAYCIF